MPSSLQQRDKEVLWHPYTQMHDYAERDLLLIDRAQGIMLYDVSGRAYYDTISSWWCILHGHNHPTITARMRRQLERLDQVLLAGTSHEGAIELAEKLVAMTPAGLDKVFYSDNGSTACEIALKMSLQYWRLSGQSSRKKFVALEQGYHGDTIGTMSLGGVPDFHGPFADLLFDSFTLPSPYCFRCPMGCRAESCGQQCLDSLERLLSEQGTSIAAVIVEPLIQAAGGMRIYPPAYLRRLAELTREHGVHLILDEVATGFGRTGKMFAFEHAGIVPDFLCLSKALTGGTLPMAATMTSNEIYFAFYGAYRDNKTFFHGHTFTGNPLAAAAALGSLQVFDEELPYERMTRTIPYLHGKMERFRELPWVGDVRCLGMIAALELVRDEASREPFGFEQRVGWPIYLKGLEEGLLLRPLGNVIYLWLPISTSTDDIDYIIEGMWRVLSNAANIAGFGAK